MHLVLRSPCGGTPARLRMAIVVVCCLFIAGCGRTSDPGPSTGDAYEVVLDWLMEQPEMQFGDSCGDHIIFVESLGSNEIALDVQVEVVNRYEDTFEIRFIDARQEAIDETKPQSPVRDGCLLVGLGPLADGEATELRAEMYRPTGVDAYRFELTQRSGAWRLVAEPTRVDPEGLVAEQ